MLFMSGDYFEELKNIQPDFLISYIVSSTFLRVFIRSFDAFGKRMKKINPIKLWTGSLYV